jgi:hypothetical protein
MGTTKKARVKSFPIALLSHASLVQASVSAFVIRSDREAVKSRRKDVLGQNLPSYAIWGNILKSPYEELAQCIEQLRKEASTSQLPFTKAL